MPHTLETFSTMLASMPVYWTSLAATVPDEIIRKPAAPGEWSALQCLQHLLDTESQVFPVRLRVFLAGGDAFPGFNPDEESTDYSKLSAAEIAAAFARHRIENLQLLQQIQPEHLSRSARHSELGMVTLEEMLNEWVCHDFNHTIQAERALMQPFILNSGPWRHYFVDHDLANSQ
ncbi:MAG: DinB family protein [Chloroflexia bacterium]